MAKVQVPFKLEPSVLEELDGYAKGRGATRQALLETAVVSFLEDCKAGVPELREAAARQASLAQARQDTEQGVGACPGRAPGLGHLWHSHRVSPERVCRFCPKEGREFFREATAERAELFSRLEAPASVRVWGRS